MRRLFFFPTFLLVLSLAWSPGQALAQGPTITVDDVPVGAYVMIPYGPNCPTGYTKLTGYDDRFPRISALGSLVIPFTGGSSSHRHVLDSGTALGGSSLGYAGTTTGGPDIPLEIWTTAGTGSRLIARNTTDSVSNVPLYLDLVFCQKTSSYEVEIPEPSITATIEFTPTYVESPYAYTTTLDTGNNFRLERSVTYGDIISGAGSIMVFVLLVIIFVRSLFHDRNA